MNVALLYSQHDLLVYENKVRKGDSVLVFHPSFINPQRLTVIEITDTHFKFYVPASFTGFSHVTDPDKYTDLFIARMGRTGHSTRNRIVPSSPLAFEEAKNR